MSDYLAIIAIIRCNMAYYNIPCDEVVSGNIFKELGYFADHVLIFNLAMEDIMDGADPNEDTYINVPRVW